MNHAAEGALKQKSLSPAKVTRWQSLRRRAASMMASRNALLLNSLGHGRIISKIPTRLMWSIGIIVNNITKMIFVGLEVGCEQQLDHLSYMSPCSVFQPTLPQLPHASISFAAALLVVPKKLENNYIYVYLESHEPWI